jgi:ABC-type glycerol-3-phosphate transport system permease component
VLVTLPVLVLNYLFLSEWFVKGMTAGAIKG